MADDASNTGENRPQNKGQFRKNDPRINRKGRPKSFDELRSLGQQIAHEVAKTGDGAPIVIDGHAVTVTEAIMRKLATSKDPRERALFLKITFGEEPQRHEIGGPNGGPIAVTVKILRGVSMDDL